MDRRTTLWLGLVRRTLNRLTRRLARAGFGPFTLIRVRGRKTGLIRETPIIVARHPDGFVIELTYGPGVQWHRNLVAAGVAVLEHGAVRWEVAGPHPLPTDEGRSAFRPWQQRVLRAAGRTHFELLRPTGRTWTRRPGPRATR